MKKILLLTCLNLILSSAVLASETSQCNSGSIYRGKNSVDYCISLKTMNWWSAFQWCATQGMHLATLDELCNYNGETWQSNRSCPNYTKPHAEDWVWTATISPSSGKAYRAVQLMLGAAETSVAYGKAVCIGN